MAPDSRNTKVFISSFYEEFRREQKALKQSLIEKGYVISDIGSWGGLLDDFIKAHLKLIEDSDVFIGIYGSFHGGMVPISQPPYQADYSYLELEFRTADELGKPILAFVQRVRGRDEEMLSLLPLIVKRHNSYYFDTGKDLIQKVHYHLENLFEIKEKSGGIIARLESETIIQPKVFLSYAREDIEAAQRLYDDLRKAGINVWFDREALLPGQKWKTAIKGAIRESRFFLALLSSNSVSKIGYVQKELKEALDKMQEYPEPKIFLIPIRLDICSPSDSRLSELQWVDMFPDWGNGLAQIVRTIKSQA